MVTGEKIIGKRYDGGRSPLVHEPDIGAFGALPLDVPPIPSTPQTVHHPILNLTTDYVVRDLERIVRGDFTTPFESDIVKRCVKDNGVDLEYLRTMSESARARLHNKIIRTLKSQIRGNHEGVLRGTLLDGMRHGRDSDPVQMPDGTCTTIGRIRQSMTRQGLTVESLAALSVRDQDRATRRAQREIRAEQAQRAPSRDPRAEERARRTELHVSLREWARGPLALEHPQGSSWHHMMEYDARITHDREDGDAHDTLGDIYRGSEPQIFVVERDWARAFAGYDLAKGESPLPFPHCCFEFRISGVRVLALFREDEGQIYMFCIYGRGGVWVADDYGYWIGDGTFRSVRVGTNLDHVEFSRVARLVHDNVRVACIMVDASVAERQHRVASPALVRKRTQEKRPPPRDHYVMDLKKRHAPSGMSRGVGGGGTSGVKQRGHFRRGTWVHYDDPDSGQVQYVDAGGFWHSRTWRNWHFAGDPNNLITKEYRL